MMIMSSMYYTNTLSWGFIKPAELTEILVHTDIHVAPLSHIILGPIYILTLLYYVLRWKVANINSIDFWFDPT